MRVEHEELSDVTRYIRTYQATRLEEKETHFRSYMQAVERFRSVNASTQILEIGTGTGWFPLLCQRKGLQCKGLEISPQLVAHARKLGAEYGLDPDIELGNIEESDIGFESFDIIIASSIFEHVEHWRAGLERVCRALRPGGVLFFESTNKFSLTSGEHWFPLYGWYPNRVRYWLRRRLQGDDIMKLGIDFHQFTYPTLRKEFRKLGFSEIHDRVDLAIPAKVSAGWKRWPTALAKRSRLLKPVALTFSDTTRFVCVK
jgi:2-polyprenyl-3-methyl-5-hydroxy-6-metoxy-1,4-benzoquinol methylase